MPYIQQLLAFSAKSHASDIVLKTGALPALKVHGLFHLLRGAEAFGPEADEEFRSLAGGAIPPMTDVCISLPWIGRFRVRRAESAGLVILHIRVHALESIDCTALMIPDGFLRFFDEAPEGLILIATLPGRGATTTIHALVDRCCRNGQGFGMIYGRIAEIELPPGPLPVGRQAFTNADDLALALEGEHVDGPRVVGIDFPYASNWMTEAIRLARLGRKVICGIPAKDAGSAIDKTLRTACGGYDLAKAALSEVLVGVLGQHWVQNRDGKRSMVFEVLRGTPAIRAQIADRGVGFHLRSAIQCGGGLGMQTYEQALGVLLSDGVIDLPEAASHGVQASHPAQPREPVVDVEPLAHQPLDVEATGSCVERSEADLARLNKIAGFRNGLVILAGQPETRRLETLQTLTRRATHLPRRVAAVLDRNGPSNLRLGEVSDWVHRVEWNDRDESLAAAIMRVRHLGAEIVVCPFEPKVPDEIRALDSLADEGLLVIVLMPSVGAVETVRDWVGHFPAMHYPYRYGCPMPLRAVICHQSVPQEDGAPVEIIEWLIAPSLAKHLISEGKFDELSRYLERTTCAGMPSHLQASMNPEGAVTDFDALFTLPQRIPEK